MLNVSHPPGQTRGLIDPIVADNSLIISHLIASSVATALVGGYSSGVLSQDDTIEEIVVTGHRSAQET